VQKLSMNDAVKYSVMVVLGATVQEYAAEAPADALPACRKAHRLLTNSWMVGPNPTMTKE
jgi:hypothetical protein